MYAKGYSFPMPLTKHNRMCGHVFNQLYVGTCARARACRRTHTRTTLLPSRQVAFPEGNNQSRAVRHQGGNKEIKQFEVLAPLLLDLQMGTTAEEAKT
jgi:hypothetical protein